MLVDAGVRVDMRLANGSFPLFIACQEAPAAAACSIVRALMEARAPVNQSTDTGATPLYMAASKGLQDVIQALVEAGADIDRANVRGCTPLFIACQRGESGAVEQLLALQANPVAVDAEGASPMYVACQNGHLPIVELLAHAGER
eukprot:6745450-Prymnesium_polylepis.2